MAGRVVTWALIGAGIAGLLLFAYAMLLARVAGQDVPQPPEDGDSEER